MGIVNVTPDSFSDGNQFLSHDLAIAHGHALFEAGADVIDVGGESTRPGSIVISVEEEIRRVIPVVRALAEDGIRVSIDTSQPLWRQQLLKVRALLTTSMRLDERVRWIWPLVLLCLYA